MCVCVASVCVFTSVAPKCRCKLPVCLIVTIVCVRMYLGLCGSCYNPLPFAQPSVCAYSLPLNLLVLCAKVSYLCVHV